jgi:transcription elongation factor Elf1
MGCFDTFRFNCPACGLTNEVQTKAGGCDGHTYGVNSAPLLIIASVNARGKRGDLACGSCSAELELEVRFTAAVKVRDVPSDDDWREV